MYKINWKNPVDMAKAFAMATDAGRIGYEAQLATAQQNAVASSPLTLFL